MISVFGETLRDLLSMTAVSSSKVELTFDISLLIFDTSLT